MTIAACTQNSRVYSQGCPEKKQDRANTTAPVQEAAET